MKLNFGKSLATTVASLVAAAALASTEVPAGTPVSLVFDQELNSRHAHVGDKVKLHVAEDVDVNGKVVLRRGTPVWATIDSVRKNERFGINANMKLDIHSVNGIPLKERTAGKDSGSRADHAALAAGGGALVLGPIGLLGGYFIVGKPVKVKVGDHLDTQVASDTWIH
jgi:hypothetical protein